ncbi:hypothetical protein GUITHDRAFT_112862 [Guillardia theta CCMP2712]|uniref:U3 small nucleolar RNA-associated protein 14 n=1 Tax=Guillardia theta (strain CCMP2712) TaxID=905079 RepID=L1IYZ7_GUITC|nr:hypothetical protein GUITHDRAFT_112862 [Guillardia theta CCMP2712]EKX41129.1 hypothetical protein GUITHDRAFT_112862 [Guillardia theta CCMP2712]|eukprot:XP_005828109.1 hypothetical protein GUITHDRAFT_112862 [Guillardia theta CCMP2712]
MGKKGNKKVGEDVYEESDEDEERRQKDEKRRFAGVDIYEYEQPDHFSDDEEIDEDEAFGEDDYDRYGDLGGKDDRSCKRDELLAAFLNSGGENYRDEDEDEDEAEGSDDMDDIFNEDGGEDEQSEGEEEEEEEEDDEDRHMQLLAAVKATKKKEEQELSYVPAAAEGEFGVGTQGKQLSLSSLLDPLKSKQSMKSVVKDLEEVEGKRAVAVPAPTIVTQRAMRQVGYEDTKNTVTHWLPIVKKNREAEHVSFPLKMPTGHNVTASSIISSFKPQTSLEQKIGSMISAAGADEASLQKSEELELRKLSVEDVQARQKELAKMRSLLFHAEIKAKRINKIKSKKFHKVSRKYKEKEGAIADKELKELDPEAYKERMEMLARKRAEERLTLKHKNTSKWAIEEQIRMGERLRKKQLEAESEEEDEEEEDKKFLDEARKEDVLGPQLSQEKVKGVMGMAFMQRSMEKQREEASKLLADLNAMHDGEDLSDASEFEEDGAQGMRRKKQEENEQGKHFEGESEEEEEAAAENPNKSGKKKNKKRKSSAGPLKDGNTQIDEVAFSTGSTLVVQERTGLKEVVYEAKPGGGGGGGKNMQSAKKEAKKESKEAKKENNQQQGGGKQAGGDPSLKIDFNDELDTKHLNGKEEEAAAAETSSNPWLATPGKAAGQGKKKQSESEGKEGGAGKQENPWLSATNASERKERVATQDADGVVSERMTRKEAKRKATEMETMLDLNVTLGKVGKGGGGGGGGDRQKKKAKGEEGEEQEPEPPAMLSGPSKEQVRLMQAAFADADMEAEFEEEKREIMESTKPKLVEATPGWGGWGGEGVREKEKARKVLEVSYKKTQQERMKKAMIGEVPYHQRQDKDLSHVIISEKRNRHAAKYLVEKHPHQPLGPDWNTANMHKKMIQKTVQIKTGKMIDPIALPTTSKSKKNALMKIASRPKAPVRE